MNTKAKILIRGAVTLVLIGLGVLARFLIPTWVLPIAAPAGEHWPADSWRTSTPEVQGYNSANLM